MSKTKSQPLSEIVERNYSFELRFESRTCKFAVEIYELPDRRFVHRTKHSGNHDKCFRQAAEFLRTHIRNQESDDEQLPRLPFAGDKETE